MSLKDLIIDPQDRKSNMNDTIKYSFWLRFCSDGTTPNISKNPPAMGTDERAMKCSVELPKSLFVRPQLTATIKVGEMPQEPLNFDIEAAENVLSEVLGARVVFSVEPPEPEGRET